MELHRAENLLKKELDEAMVCDSGKIQEVGVFGDYPAGRSEMLIYPYHEGGYFETGQNFGCVHFEQKED